MKEEQRLSSFVNLTVNSTVIVGALLTEAMTGAMGDVAVGMTEGAAEALDNTGNAKQKGAEMRREMSRNVSAMVREMVAAMLPETRAELESVIDRLPPDRKKELLEDISDASYDRAFEAIRKHDFGLPGLTERLSADDVLGYLDIAKKQPSRLEEVMGPINGLKEPRLFAELKRAVKTAGAGTEDAAPEAKADPVPPTIRELPATYLFPPGAETTISLRGDKELKIRWTSKPGPGTSYADFGIMVRQDGSTVKTPSGGMTLHPEKGGITATMKNLEAFSIAVEIRVDAP